MLRARLRVIPPSLSVKMRMVMVDVISVIERAVFYPVGSCLSILKKLAKHPPGDQEIPSNTSM